MMAIRPEYAIRADPGSRKSVWTESSRELQASDVARTPLSANMVSCTAGGEVPGLDCVDRANFTPGDTKQRISKTDGYSTKEIKWGG